MPWLSRLVSFSRHFFRRQQRENDLDEELHSVLELLTEQKMREGADPEEARRAARIELGGVEQVKERVREARVGAWLDAPLQDVRFGLRILRKNPGFTVVAVLTLALGIGATTAIFSVVYGVLLRPLPFPEPNRVAQLAEIYQGHNGQMSVTATQLQRLRDFDRPFEAISGYTDVDFNVTASNGAEHVRAMPVSSDFLHVLGERPEAGRDFLAAEDTGTGEQVALVTHALAVRHFGSDAAAVEQTLSLSGQPYTVIGVMPAHFAADLGALDGGPAWAVWIPLARVAKTVGGGENISVLARLKPGATWAEVSAETELAKRDFHKEFPGDAGDSDFMSFMPLAKLAGADVRPYLLVLFGATGFVLLIACANVSNLLLARGSARTREMAVRMAMGASRMRLLRQLLTESMLIAVAGGALGLGIAREGISTLVAMTPSGTALGTIGLPRINEIRVDWTILAFALAISFLTGALFGIVLALYAGKADLSQKLREGSTGAGVGRGHALLRQALVAGEFALSLVLLTGAGLMIATCVKLLNTNPGFDPRHVLAMEFWLGGSTHDTTPKVAEYYQQIEQKVARLPGVEAVGVVAAGLPLERGGNDSIRIAGPNESERHSANYREASPGYFRAMGLSLRQGRGILESDTDTASRVVVVNEALAKRYFTGRSPLGEHVYVGGTLCEVVGVVADVKSFLDEPPVPSTFIPAAQASYETSKLFEGWFPRSIAVRANVDSLSLSRAVKGAVASVDPLVPMGEILSMNQMMSRSLEFRRFMMLLLSIFSGLALVLASVGIYGVISFAVAQRTQEIGIRMALGARSSDVLKIVLTEGLKLVVAGMVLGIAAALILTKLLAGILYGVSIRDPAIFTLVCLFLVVVALLACWIPARRASRLDPMVALRHE
jgi:putative ABC transport system permease protein